MAVVFEGDVRCSLKNAPADLVRIGTFISRVVICGEDKEVGGARLKSCHDVAGYVSLKCGNRRAIATR